jgi:hypothetical protein
MSATLPAERPFLDFQPRTALPPHDPLDTIADPHLQSNAPPPFNASR